MKVKKLNALEDILGPFYINKYLPFTVMTLSYSNITHSNLILFTGDKDIDTSLNSMKAKAFQLISVIIQSEGHSIKNLSIIENLSNTVNLAISTLSYVVEDKVAYISEMDKNNVNAPDNSYDFLLYQIMFFLSRFLTREPIVTQFTGFVKK